jgi:DHA3 family multidrug efflux protein-like MFS transporter
MPAMEDQDSHVAEGSVATPDEVSAATFRQLLWNTLVSGVTSSFLWFALTFWVFLETRSVVVTGVVGASFSICSAVLGPAAGTYVDRHRKHDAMILSSRIGTVCFLGAAAVYFSTDGDDLLRLRNPLFWVLVLLTLGGSVAGSLRSIALSTCVSLLVPEGERDKANGLIGMVGGISFAITSVFSGLAIGLLSMGWALGISVVLTSVTLIHLHTIHVEEPVPVPAEGDPTGHVDVKGALEAIHAVPGLLMIILLAAFNNLLGGVFMALMDAYGLYMVSVETWGLLWGGISLAFIAGGLGVARYGLGRLPLRLIVLCNLINWTVCATFTLRSSVIPLTIGMFIWLTMVPIIEAAEQTVLQRSIPFERQGRVFGFAQLIENAASPFTALLIGPIAERVFMPFMTDGRGVDWIGDWFGTGPDRGLALVFTLAGLIGIVVTLLVWGSRSYRRLAEAWVPLDGELTAA